MDRSKRALALAVAVGALSPAAQAACDFAAPALTTEIPTQTLWDALNSFGTQMRLTTVAPADPEAEERVLMRSSPRIPAATAPEKALRRMLRGTGLRYVCVARGLRIEVVPPPVEPEPSSEVLSEIIVTGEGNQPNPTDTTVLTAADLRDAGAKGIDDIARRTPGVEFNALSSVSSGPYTNIAIRGVTDRHGNAAGIWIDDVPLPAVASNTFIRGYPYVFDVARVEVLRGPQPALLGANAQGGAVQFMSRQPGLAKFDGQAFIELADTAGGDVSWEGGAAFGGPLQPGRIGLRVSGWYREDGGYVDRVDPFTREVVGRNANRIAYGSARVALSFHPDDGVMLLPALYYQSTRVRDSSQFMLWESPAFPADRFSDPRRGEFRNGSLVRQPFGDSYVLASLKSLFTVGGLDVQGVTGYLERAAFMYSEDTESRRWGDFGNPRGLAYPDGPEDLVLTHVTTTQRSFTQQLKLASDPSRRLSWVAGTFFAYTRTRETDHVQAPYSTPPVIQGLGWDSFNLTVPTVIVSRQLAGYGLLSWRPGRSLKMNAGLRIERHRADADVTTPASMPPLPSFMAPLDTDQRGRNTVVAPQFGLTWDDGNAARGRVREYHVIAGKGYAPGSIEAARPTCLESATVYPADTLWSYEAGTRQGWWDGQLQLDVNLFHIVWDNGDEARRTCLFMHLPGRARSRGFDLAARAQLGAGLEVTVEAAWVDATYRQTLYNAGPTRIVDINGPVPQDGSLIVSRGDAIGTPPLVAAPWNVTTALEQRLGLGSFGTLLLRLEDLYRSSNSGSFYTAHPDFYAAYQAPDLAGDPATHLLNFRASFRRGTARLDLFVNNLLDARPVLQKRNKGNDQVTLFYAATERPRTVGLSMNWSFGSGR